MGGGGGLNRRGGRKTLGLKRGKAWGGATSQRKHNPATDEKKKLGEQEPDWKN